MRSTSITPTIYKLFASALLFSQTYAMEQHSPLKLGLIGMGAHMTEKLIPALNSTQFTLKYGCRQNLDALKIQQEEFGITQITTNFTDILNLAAVEAIVVAGNPEQLHVPVVKSALLADLPIFVEKPISLSIQTVREFAKQAEQSKVIAMVGFNMTHTPTANLLQEKFSRNEITDILITCSLGVKPKNTTFEEAFNNAYYFSFIHAVAILVKIMGIPTDIQVEGTKTKECLNGFYLSATCKNDRHQTITLWFGNGETPAGFNLGGYYRNHCEETHCFNLTDKHASGGSEKQHSYKHQMNSFYTCIKEGRQPENNFQRNLEIHEIMEDIKIKLKLKIDFNGNTNNTH